MGTDEAETGPPGERAAIFDFLTARVETSEYRGKERAASLTYPETK
jgi:hypothetical protein